VIISFEGGEGAGKSTNVERLCSCLSTKELPCLSLREPGGSVLSEEVRRIFLQHDMHAMTELLLVLASRRQNISEIIEPALKTGMIVVMDRFVDSTIVYQGIMGELGADFVQRIMMQTGTWLEPDLTFLMDVDPELSLKRIEASDRFENRDLGYHKRLREAFKSISGHKRFHIIDSGLDRDRVHEQVIHVVERYLDKILNARMKS